MKLNLSRLESSILSYFKNHFIEAVLGLCFFVMFILSDNVDDKDYNETLQNTMLLFPLFFALTYTCHKVFIHKLRLLYYLSLFFFIPALFINLGHFVFSISYGFTLLLAFFLLLISRSKQNNRMFAKESIQTIIHLIISFFIGHVMELAIAAIIGSLIYIFNLNWIEGIRYAYFFILFIIIPLIFCRLQDEEHFKEMPRFMDIIITYILSPGIIIYTGILYLYFITIIVHWELPKGGIGYMVLAFVILALGGKMSQLIVSKRYYDWFYHYFSFIAIPPLIIFWIGTIERISTYSFTTSRVYLLAAGLLMTLYIFLLLSKRFGNYQMMLVISAFCIAALTYIPGISAKSIGIHAQEKRLIEYINKLNALDSKTHKLKSKLDDAQNADTKDIQELYEAYNYLRKEWGYEYIEVKYGTCDFPSVFNDNWMHISLKGKVDMTGYRYYQPFNYNEFDTKVINGVLTLTRNKEKEIIMEYNMDQRLKALPDTFFQKNEKDQQELLILKNERYMVVLDNIALEKTSDGYHCQNVSVGAILSHE